MAPSRLVTIGVIDCSDHRDRSSIALRFNPSRFSSAATGANLVPNNSGDPDSKIGMDLKLFDSPSEHSLAADKFLYFFMGLRKGEIRRRVVNLKARHPDEGPEELAKRLILTQSTLSIAGGALLHVPLFLPGLGPTLKLLGMAGGASVLMRMHMSLVLEIALLFGHDIDEPERLKEIAAIIVASGLVACTPLLTQALDMKSYYALITGGMTVSSASKLIGEAALIYYRKRAQAKTVLPEPDDIATAEG